MERDTSQEAQAIVDDRRALHRIPEVGLDLPLTADYCERALRALGLAPRRIGSGMTVDLGSAGPRFAWRTDMDALPIQEEAGRACASEIPGRMHACGHDAHMAIALGIARHYTAQGVPLPCRLRLIFQPGEEGHHGARQMVQGGALEGVEALAGLHVGSIFPELPRGCFGTRKGAVMAGGATFEATFQGRGAHGAHPHLAADALLAAAQFVAALQTVRYSGASPVHPTVISVGSFRAGDAANVIPGQAVVTGTLRTTTLEDMPGVSGHLDRLARGLALANGVEVSLHNDLMMPLTANTDPALADLLEAAVLEAHGPGRFMWLPDPTLGGEDFGDYLEHVPGVFFFLGTSPGPAAALHHHPGFDVAEEVLPAAIPVVDALLRAWARS
jgi:amidohydrolase